MSYLRWTLTNKRLYCNKRSRT